MSNKDNKLIRVRLNKNHGGYRTKAYTKAFFFLKKEVLRIFRG